MRSDDICTAARLAGRPMALAPRAFDGLLALARELREPLPRLRLEERDAARYVLTEDGIAVVSVASRPPGLRNGYGPRFLT